MAIETRDEETRQAIDMIFEMVKSGNEHFKSINEKIQSMMGVINSLLVRVGQLEKKISDRRIIQ